MNGTIRLSGEAILYTVLRMRRTGIYGVENVLAGLNEKEFPTFIQRTEQELAAASLGEMDFDGAFSLAPEYGQLIAACADAKAVVGAGLRRGGEQRTLTFYSGKKTGPVLTRTGETYELTAEADPVEAILTFLAPIGEPEQLPPQVTADTALVEQRDLEGLVSAGCTEPMAQLILDAVEGREAFLRVEKVGKEIRSQEIHLIYGAAGIFRIGVEYTETQELFTFTPVSLEELKALLQDLTEGGAA